MINFSSIFGQDNSVSVHQLKEAIETQSFGTILDIRTLEEFNHGHIKGSISLPQIELSGKISALIPDITSRIYVISQKSDASAEAVKSLKGMGYSNALNVRGGIIDWIGRKYPLTV